MDLRDEVKRVASVADELLARASRRFGNFPPGAVDLVLAITVTMATVGPAIADRQSWLIVGLSILASVPVLWRRRAPILTFLIVGPAITALACLHALPALPYGTLVCAYTIAAYSPPGPRRVAGIVAGLGILFSLLVPGESLDSYGYAAMSFTTAWALGTGVRAKRDRIAMLEERTRRLDEERVAAIDRERVRIARDMHDIVTHSVGLMIVQAETGPLLTHTDPDRADTTFAAIADTGRDAVRQLRHSLGLLRAEPDPPHPPGLEAIPDLVEIACRSGILTSFEERGHAVAIPSEVAVTAYRVVQEALTNTRKHAHLTQVQVSLTWSDTRLAVRITNDFGTAAGDVGIAAGDSALTHETGALTHETGALTHETGGFTHETGTITHRLGAITYDSDTASPGNGALAHGDVGIAGAGLGKYGLIGMRERVTSVGGALHYGQSGTGFEVVAELPIGTQR